MDDSCAVCAESLEWVAYGGCGHREVCSTCVVRLRFVLGDNRCCICKTESSTVFVTKALGDYTRVITDFSVFPDSANEGQVGSYWYHEGSQAYFDDVDHYRMIKAMCRLSCSVCDKSAEEQGSDGTKRRSRFRNIEQLKGHLFHQHRMFMCSLCLEGRKVFICEQKLYTRSQLNQHINTGDSEVDGSESERGGFMGHPMCEFCKNPFYGDNELYMHMSTEHYTCHICQRQHPGQYDYFRNYDDLETHFRQEHFLCENEACLTKKFIVFQSESEMKRHNTIEHGGHMSRSKRNAALQIPTSFTYRRNNDQDQRRGRGRRPEPSNNQLSMAIQASLETAIADGRIRDSSSVGQPLTEGEETSQANRVTGSLESLTFNSDPEPPLHPTASHSLISRSSHVLEDAYFPPLSDREAPEPSSRYAKAVNQGAAAKLGGESFPPLPGAKEGSKPKAKQGPEGSGKSTLASRLNRGKGSVKVLNSARPRPPENLDLSASNSANFPQIRATQNHGLMSSTSNSKLQVATTNQPVIPSISARKNGFLSPVTSSSAWQLASDNKMKHSSSAPNLADASNQQTSGPVSVAPEKQKVMPSNSRPLPQKVMSSSSQLLPQKGMSSSSQQIPNVEDVHTANKSLVEQIRAGVGNDAEKFAAFKNISAEYRQGQINTWEYLSYVEQFGLSHLVLELARLCPETRKQKELIDAYNANIRTKQAQENGNTDAGKSSKEDKSSISSKKGKGKGVYSVVSTSTKDAFADNFLNTVRKLQSSQKPQEGEVEVLSKDGYRAGKSNAISSSVRVNISGSSGSNKESFVNNTSSGQNLGGNEENVKQRKKTSKFHRIRLGDGSAAALLDLGRSDISPERTVDATSNNNNRPSDGVPVQGVWRNSGGQKLAKSLKNSAK